MKRLMLLAIAMVALAVGAMAQTTWNQPAFTNQATSSCSPIFRNINQASHWLLYSTGSLTSGGTIYIQASSDTTHWTIISNIGTLGPSAAGIVQAGGYYPNIQACIAGLTGGTPSVTATYTASTGAIATPANAGFATSDQPVTFIPIGASTVDTNSALKSAGFELASGPAVLYGATVYNPNSGVAYVAFSSDSTPFAGGGSGTFMVAVPPSGSLVVPIAPQGIYFSTTLYEGCSTSSTAAVDPASSCVVSAYWKQAFTGGVPN